MALYVRTGSGGTAAAVLVADLGIRVPQSTSFLELTAGTPGSPADGYGQFTAIEIRNSVDLYNLIRSGALEASSNGTTNNISGSAYLADIVLVSQFSDDAAVFASVSTPSLIVDGYNFTGHLNGGPNKHHASEISVLGTYASIPGTPTSLEAAISSINTALSTAAGFTFLNITADTGTAVADSTTDTLSVFGLNGIATSANATTDTITFDGYSLLPRDGSRPMLGTLNLNSVLSTSPGLVITPNTATPTTGLLNGAITIISGIMYVYDNSRSKWLSVERRSLGAGKLSTTNNVYLRTFDSTPTSATGYRAIRDGTIIGLAAQTDGVATWTFEVRKNGALSPITTLGISGTVGNQTTVINIDFSAGDYIQAYANTGGTNILSPVVEIELAWRA